MFLNDICITIIHKWKYMLGSKRKCSDISTVRIAGGFKSIAHSDVSVARWCGNRTPLLRQLDTPAAHQHSTIAQDSPCKVTS